uniref:Uncharacterized protein n=1 Tax=Cacopsylla melanoneura TaxID=428564 RepID=A0A8D9DZV1_9HEMI
MENYVKFTMFPRTPIILKPGVCPHKFECQSMRTETHPVKRKQNLLSKRKEEEDRRTMVEHMIVSESEDEEMIDNPDLAIQELQIPETTFDPSNIPSTSQAIPVSHAYSVETVDKGIQVKIKPFHFRSVKVQCTVNSVDCSVQAVPDLVDVGTSTVEKLNLADIFSSDDDDDDIESLPTDSVASEYHPTSNSQSSDTISPIPLKKHFDELKNRVNTNTMLYLGLPTNASFVIGVLATYCKCTERDIYLCLKKIRLNEPYSILSYEFDLSPTYLGTIFRNVLPRVAECLEKFIFWPSKRQVFLKVSFNI